MKLKKIGITINCLVIAGALVLYWRGEVLNALFWMSVASAGIIMETNIKE